LLEICTPDIKDIRGLSNGYQEKIDQISMKYLTDLSRISKISSGYTCISDQIPVDCGQRAINLKNCGCGFKIRILEKSSASQEF